MLRELRIENLVLFTDCSVQFGKGLNVLTGETGAGKSLLLDALGLVLGKRADTGLIRVGADYAQVTGSFELPASHAACVWLNEHGIAMEDQVLIIREYQLACLITG